MGLFKKIGKSFTATGNAIGNAGKDSVDTVSNAGSNAVNAVNNAGNTAVNTVGNVVNNPDQVQQFATDTAKDAAKWAVDTFTSSIIIRNDSPVQTWKCTIGPDQEALKIAGITLQAVSMALTVVSLSGAFVPLSMSMSVTAALGAVNIAGGKATTLDTINKYAMKLTGTQNPYTVEGAAKSVADILNIDYQASWKVIPPGGSATFDRLTLSLLQQGTCMNSYVDPNNATQVITGTITLKPLWSGATSGAANTYPLQRWENTAKNTVTTFSLRE
eukprot:comp10108_c0_seq1/m.4951 comp10108_c0_seq1/g.4951  ORF comp10108_c0_seq1/g.4951 comp10108_c0_seq1/m.4951 type:complete len:273 (-) comp10108_c0_seq1:389-1207(-)